MKKSEIAIIVCVIVALTGLLLRMFGIPGGGILGTISLFSASSVSALSVIGVAAKNKTKPYEAVAYTSMSIGFIAILFTTMFYPGSRMMTLMTGVSFVVALIMYVVSHPSAFSKPVVYAAVVFCISCVNFIPSYKIYQFINMNPLTKSQEQIDDNIRGICYVGIDYYYNGMDSLAVAQYTKALDAAIRLCPDEQYDYLEDFSEIHYLLLTLRQDVDLVKADSVVKSDIKQRRLELGVVTE